MDATRPIETLALLGEPLCLEFSNTASMHEGEEERGDRLLAYDDVVAWSRRVGTIDEATAARLRAIASERPAEAARVFDEALELRESIYRLMRAAERGEAMAEGDLERLNAWAARALARRRLVPAADGGVAWAWGDLGGELEAPLWPVAGSAASLLSSPELERVKSCDAGDCEWLFLDTSRNRTRRWCDMGACGNRAKARRHYSRRSQRPT